MIYHVVILLCCTIKSITINQYFCSTINNYKKTFKQLLITLCNAEIVQFNLSLFEVVPIARNRLMLFFVDMKKVNLRKNKYNSSKCCFPKMMKVKSKSSLWLRVFVFNLLYLNRAVDCTQNNKQKTNAECRPDVILLQWTMST